MRISMTAIVVIVILAIVLFGAKRLPDLARSLGKSMRILKSEAQAMRSDGESEQPSRPAPAPAPVDGAAARTVQAAPGASATARPVTEPAAGASAPDGDRPH
ncbi:Sec-independent protein translocase subunit TatA [Kitasatospora xanthocidica]|uniref:Sec-independent protein translocase protein TatA n=1 Tax=Kitasatospora xanthocidica TaxID=83382 RepID=A0A372ZT94_9ACTN|nr:MULTISPECIES: Sec-independent protein translocase subunit TatA [Streptomycetaceae]OKI07499.1 preprotein translocase subunit TatA [Streptomyces sp. CB02056]RGD58754.1 Sec-independent protein translocase subunit TatA [Kitasatospora xanthocidica]